MHGRTYKKYNCTHDIVECELLAIALTSIFEIVLSQELYSRQEIGILVENRTCQVSYCNILSTKALLQSLSYFIDI